MSGPPCVVIVGRPNVGKSSLFNALAGRRLSIEDPMAGVTRDRISFVLRVEERSIELVDTGGMGLADTTHLLDDVELQIEAALALADLVLLVFDAKEGLQPADREAAERLRRLDLPVIVVANKVEGRGDAGGAGEAFALGFGEPVSVSARERTGLTELLERILGRLGDRQAPAEELPPDLVRLAIMGRMNVGKSTLVNALVGQERVIVSPVPGTTRDAVDVPFEHGGRRFVAIDTAGLRKGRSIADSVEFYSQARALRSLRRAGVVLLLIDSTEDVGRIDRVLAGAAQERAVPCIIVVNKWDLARDRATTESYVEYLRKTLPGLASAPIAFISAAERLNLGPLLELAAQLHDQAGARVGTGELNRALQRAAEKRSPKPVGGRIGKIYYGTLVGTHPPTVRLFVNEPSLFDDSWRRYLVHELQELLAWTEVPVKLEFQSRTRDAGRPQ
ncbi:MAG TPA: ribosome biogenesis GTPase Der [Planctomycetota bacterium]|nr:ribosome biogenesis GTPase Der [Planctomycetota bacterium]